MDRPAVGARAAGHVRTVTQGRRPAAATVAARQPQAVALGASLAADLGDPAAFAAALAAAFGALADPEYRDGQVLIAPGIGPTHGVRTPLQGALRAGFERASRGASPSELLLACARLLREPEREARWFAITTLQRTLRGDPERTWQLLRRAAADADEWITVDTLAHPYGKGILAESYRWAELEQMTVSPSRWERRLVGSTIATIPFVDRRLGRTAAVAEHGLALLATLMGDREPDVQKALAWAYRSMIRIDRQAALAALDHQTAIAREHADGHRAWVIRDSLGKLEPGPAARLRVALSGIRRRPDAPSTSDAAELAARFAAMGLGQPMPEPPLA